MKKVLFIILFLGVFVGSIYADVSFYGKAQVGFFYLNQDKDYNFAENNVDKSRLSFQYTMYKTSIVGLNYNSDNFKAKCELSASSHGLSLRHLYGEYNFDSISLLIGQTFTGFSEFASQVTSIKYNFDNLLIGYGMFYGGRPSMIRLSKANGYLSLIAPVNPDPKKFDALIPKINFGYKFQNENLYIHPTFGINMYKYNEDFSGYDESILSLVASTTLKLDLNLISIKGQINYGQNVATYGITTTTASDVKVIENPDGTLDVKNNSTLGGYLQVGFNFESGNAIIAGIGSIQSKEEDNDNIDSAYSTFLQYKWNINKQLSIYPEIGILDDRWDLAGEKQGSQMYFGTKLTVAFK